MGKHVDDVSQERRHTKRGILGVLVMVLVAVLLVGGTLAYFSADKTASAKFSLGDSTKVELLNSWNSANGAGSDGSGLVSGQSVNDTVRARNLGSTDCYLRLRLRITKNAGDGSAAAPSDLKDRATAKLDGDTYANNTVLNNIVGTLYNDTTLYDEATLRLVSSEGSALTPPQSTTSGAAIVKAVNLAREGVGGITSNASYGYLANSLASYADTSSRAVARAQASASLLRGDFLNVTTQEEYKHGILTFEYTGGTDGKLASAAVTKPLVTTICIPTEYTTALIGGTVDGQEVGYTISFWAESVPAADFADSSKTAEQRRIEAMDRLDDVYPASAYYPATEVDA